MTRLLSPCYVGIDAGGSKTSMMASTPSHEGIFSSERGGSNIHRIGFDSAVRLWVELIECIPVAHLASTQLHLVLGVSGAGLQEDRRKIQSNLLPLLADRFHSVHLEVLSDIELALHAGIGDDSGMVLIVGTGSIAMARLPSGELLRVGGWGYLLGDEGGGYRLGLEALQSVARSFDLNQATELSRKLCTRYHLCSPKDIIEAVYQHSFPIASIAPVLLEVAREGDEIARSILRRQLFQLARSVHTLSEKAPGVAPRLAWLGGLTRNRFYTEVLYDALQEVLPGWNMFMAPKEPVEAALSLAGYSISSAEG